MRTELETQDIEAIAAKVLELLRPHLVGNGASSDVIFDVQGLAEYLRVDVSWVRKQVAARALPYFKSGKYTRFRKREIDHWINRQTVTPLKCSAP